MIISFIGNDGSGKSTTIKHLIPYLEGLNKRVIWVPGFNHAFLEQVKKLFQAFSRKDIKKLHQEYAKPTQKKNRLFLLWPYLVFLDCIALVLKYAFRGKDTIVIFDRYPYDYIVSFRELGVSTRPAEKLFQWFPKPRHIFLFDASPEIAYERKKHDHKADVPHYYRQRERYLHLARNLKIPVINTDNDTVDVTVRKITQQLCF